MHSKVKEDIIEILQKIPELISNRNIQALKEISNNTIHNASIFQDKDSVTIAVIAYALSKMIGRIERIEPDVTNEIALAKEALLEDKTELYESHVKQIVEAISTVDKKIDLYVQHIINEAGIKKGSRLYEHGISIAQVAEIFGITQWELMKYLGQTNIAEDFCDEIDINTRLCKARELFGCGK